MSVVIEGRKAGQKQPSRPSIADDTIASISRLKALYLLSAGEVKGLANGAASIMLEGTPLVDDSGNPNFENVEWEIRHGTVDQTHIAGMPSASNEIGINVQLSSDTPYIRSITNTQLSSINVNLSFPLLKNVTDKGDVVGTTVAYAIDVQTDGNGYVTMLNTSLTAKTSGRYQKTYNVKLPDAQNNWQIRVRKITADGDNELLFNGMQVDSIAEIIDAKLRYPCSALLYLSFDAKTFSNIPKLSVDMQGVYVQVPSNYDTATRTSTGIWDGTFKQGYTTNPAWHYYDLITNKRYGLGDKIQPFMINKWALEHIARVCDEPVDDGKGGTEPRFTCNLYLQKAEDAYQVLQHVAGIFRGMSFWNGSQIVVDADTARDAEYVITRANVINGAFVKTGSAASDRHTIAKVAWSNPANAYETEYVMVRNEQAIAEFGINILDLSAVGCTSEGQAYRMGLAALLAEINRTQTVSFAMGLDGSLPVVGSRLDIADMMFTGANNGGRISSVSANRQVITVDRDNVPATVGDKLIVNLESGKAQERVITAINGRAITVAIAFDPVASQNVWAVNTAEMPTMPFIVMSVTQNEDATQYNYTAMQYDPSMYAQIDNGTIIEQRPVVPTNNPYIIAAPETVTLDSRHRIAQGLTVTTLIITWAQVKEAVAYDVEWRKDDGDWVTVPRTGNISVEIDGVYSGNYLARVRAVSAFDAISKPVTSMLTAIEGKVGLPPTIVSLTATGVLFGMELRWGFGQGSGDSDYTEIQVGSSPDVNVAALTQASYPTNTHTISGLQGGLSQSYKARLVDKLGNKSAWSSWVTATTDNSADKVLDLIEGQITDSALDNILKTKIADIQINKEAIGQETQDRIEAIIAANGRVDSVVADVDVEYYLSSDALTPTGGTWLTDAPMWQQGKYMFSRTKTVLADGTVSYTPDEFGTNITGAKGDKGDKGATGAKGAKGIDGVNGIDGLEGTKGDKGIKGDKGADGTSSYTHLAYATSTTGDNFSPSHFANATYIGMYVGYTDEPDSGDYTDYNWSLIKGADGSKGIQGAKGEDGLTPFFHVAYANSADGKTGFSTTVSLGKSYIGQYTDYLPDDAEIDDVGLYNWTSIKGADGTDGAKGDKGSSGIDGDKGDVGQGVESIVEQYGISKFKGIEPTTWTTTVPEWTNGDYVWTRSEITYKNPYGVEHTDPVIDPAWNAITESYVNFVDFKEKTETDFSVTGERLDGIIADYRPRYADKDRHVSASAAEQWTYAKSVAASNYSSNERITNLQSEFADSNANVTKTLFTLTEQDKSIASDMSQLYTEVGANYGLIQDLDIAISTAETGLAAKITELQSSSDSNANAASDAQTTADQAISDAQSKSAAAETAAKNFAILEAQAKADAAQAIASGDATDKANAAKSQAIADAALDAKNKADAAQDAASALANTAQDAADAAQGSADDANDKLLPANLGSLVELSGAFSDEFGAIAGNITNIQGVVDGQQTAIETISAVGNAEKLKNEIAKARLDKNVTNLNAQSTALTTQINDYTSKVADLTAKRNATTDVALKAKYNGLIADINAAKTDLTAQKADTADQVVQLNAEKVVLDSLKATETDVKAQYTIKIDAGGAVVGYGLVVGNDNVSNFNIRANNINFLPPANGVDDGISQMVVRNTTSVIDGVTVPAGLYTRNFYAPRASIDTIQIKDAAIKSAQIGEAQVDSLQIKGEAVIVPRGQFISTDLKEFASVGVYQTINEATIDARGGAVAITFGFERLEITSSGNIKTVIEFHLRKNGNSLRKVTWKSKTTNGSLIVENYVMATYMDTPLSGSNTYSIDVLVVQNGYDIPQVNFLARSLFVMGARR